MSVDNLRSAINARMLRDMMDAGRVDDLFAGLKVCADYISVCSYTEVEGKYEGVTAIHTFHHGDKAWTVETLNDEVVRVEVRLIHD